MQHRRARGEDLRLAHDARRARGVAERLAGALARELQDRRFGRGMRIVDADVQQEAIELRFGQRIGAFLLDRVLRRHDQEQRRQRIRVAADRDLPLGHRLEHRRLHFRRRAVDLVGEDQVVEDRAALELEASRSAGDRSRCR